MTLVLLLLIPTVLSTHYVQSANSAPNAELYFSPQVTPVLSKGSSFTVQVKVANMPLFNGWDVIVFANQSIINAVSLTNTTNIMTANSTGTSFSIVSCVNGVGTGCTAADGPGIVHSEFGDTKATSGDGLLFNITYQVASTRTYSPITIQRGQISNAGQFVAHDSQNGYYGIAKDFQLSATVDSLTVNHGSSNSTQILVTSLRNFAAVVNLTTTSPPHDVVSVLNTTKVSLAANATVAVLLTVTAARNASSTSFPITVSGQSGNLTRPVQVSVLVQAKPDFEIAATPDELRTPAATPNIATITVFGESNFNGTVNLSVDAWPGTQSSLDRYSLYVPPNGSNSTVFRVTAQPSDVRFRDVFNITGISIATGYPITHVLQVVVEPPPADFSIVPDQQSPTVQAGESKVVTLSMSSLYYYSGTVYLLAIGQSGVGFSISPNVFYLDISQTVSASLTLTTDQGTPAGQHTVTVNAVGDKNSHSFNVTLIVEPISQTISLPRPIFGIPPAVFFGVIVALGVILAVVAVRETRRSKPQRSILQG